MYAYSVLTNDNMRQPEMAFCSMLGATYTQKINVYIGRLHRHSNPVTDTVIAKHMFVSSVGFNQAILCSRPPSSIN
jgi:hypothetical protein